MTKIAFYTLGCKLNFSETSAISRDLISKGFTIVSFIEEADYYVINSCTVTHEAEKKFMKLARSAKKRKPESKVIAIGCFAELRSEKLDGVEDVDLLLGTNQKYDLYKYLEGNEQITEKISQHSTFSEKNYFHGAFSLNDRTRSFLKIQDGCDYFCSYCIIPLARGKSRSDTVVNILNSVRKIIDSGVKEIVLTGVNIGDFRSPEGHRLIDLLFALEEIKDLERLTLSSIEPDLLNDEIIELVSRSTRILPHFHIPLQSGSDKILDLMHRKYDTVVFRKRIQKIRELIPHAFIGVDVLVGFPGEDDEDFRSTYDFLAENELSYLHVFPFSERPDTKAALMDGKVPEKIIRARVRMLLDLSESKKRTYYEKFCGTVRSVLFEKKIKDGFIYGLTDNYLRTKVTEDFSLINKISLVELTGLDLDGVIKGKLIND